MGCKISRKSVKEAADPGYNRIMSQSRSNHGTIVFPNHSCVALWTHEVTGQISDGHWENSGPRDHFRFWCSLETRVEEASKPRVEAARPWECKRWYYGLNSLVSMKHDDGTYVLRGRMINLGRMADAAAKLGRPMEYEQRIAAEEMPETLKEFLEKAKGNERFNLAVPYDLALEYYSTQYGLSELRRDVGFIRAAMETMK